MCNVVVGAVTNIILDVVFINGIGMGVKGAMKNCKKNNNFIGGRVAEILLQIVI